MFLELMRRLVETDYSLVMGFKRNAGGKTLSNVTHGFSFVAGLIERGTGLVEQVSMTRFHTMYSQLFKYRTGYESS